MYFHGNFKSPTKAELGQLIELGDGSLVSDPHAGREYAPPVDRNSCRLADSSNRACSVIVVCDDAEAARSLSTFMQPGAHAFPLPLGNPPALALGSSLRSCVRQFTADGCWIRSRTSKR